MFACWIVVGLEGIIGGAFSGWRGNSGGRAIG